MRDNGSSAFCCMFCRVLDPYDEEEAKRRCKHYCVGKDTPCLHRPCPLPKLNRCPYEKEVVK